MKNNDLFAVVLVGLLSPGLAIGQMPILADDCTQDTGCLTLKEQAAERSKGGDFVEALRLYKLAYEVRPDPRLLFNVARLLHKQGKMAEAVPYYQKFIDAPVQDEEQRQKAREYLEQIQTGTARPAPKQPDDLSSQPTGRLSTEAVRADAQSVGKPVYKKWWLWTTVGSGVLAITAIGLGVGLSKRQSTVPPDVNTYEPSF